MWHYSLLVLLAYLILTWRVHIFQLVSFLVLLTNRNVVLIFQLQWNKLQIWTKNERLCTVRRLHEGTCHISLFKKTRRYKNPAKPCLAKIAKLSTCEINCTNKVLGDGGQVIMCGRRMKELEEHFSLVRSFDVDHSSMLRWNRKLHWRSRDRYQPGGPSIWHHILQSGPDNLRFYDR